MVLSIGSEQVTNSPQLSWNALTLIRILYSQFSVLWGTAAMTESCVVVVKLRCGGEVESPQCRSTESRAGYDAVYFDIVQEYSIFCRVSSVWSRWYGFNRSLLTVYCLLLVAQLSNILMADRYI